MPNLVKPDGATNARSEPQAVHAVENPTGPIKSQRGRKVGWRKPKTPEQGLDKPKGKPGRPRGSVVKLMNDLSDLTMEDFSFIRAVASGIKSRDAFLQYYIDVDFDVAGKPMVPHGHDLNHQVDQIVKRIVSVAKDSQSVEVRRAATELSSSPIVLTELDAKAKDAVEASFEDWFATVPDGFYSERELPEAYSRYLDEQRGGATQEEATLITQSLGVNQKIKAINLLQSTFAKRPRLDDAVSFWFAPTVSTPLKSLQLSTINSLISFIETHGPKWHLIVRGQAKQERDAALVTLDAGHEHLPKGKRPSSKVIFPKGPSPAQAIRIEHWLDSHAETCRPISRQTQAWLSRPTLPMLGKVRQPTELAIDPHSGNYVPAPAGHLQPRSGIVPLELLLVPKEIDGSLGVYRAQGANQLGVNTDYEAICLWLDRFRTSERSLTFTAYRKEAERFYLWCIEEAGIPLSSVNMQYAQAYQNFLKRIPDEWITRTRQLRTDPRWRPFRGQLMVKNQNYALTVLKNMFAFLRDVGYLNSSAFAALLSNVAIGHDRTLDTTRTFHQDDLELIKRALDTLPGLKSKDPLKAAIARRTRLIMHLGMTTGMRLSEIVNSSTVGLKNTIINNAKSEDLAIVVIGKRAKAREVVIGKELHALILEHHADWKAQLDNGDERLAAFEKRPPLVAALKSPVGQHTEKTAMTTEDNDIDIGDEQRKTTQSRAITNSTILANDNSALSQGGIYRSMKSFFRHVQKIAENDTQRERLIKSSPHWMRHTFAHQAMLEDKTDSGLMSAKGLLGHTSINTTAEYAKQDITARVLLARKIRPLG